jgi:hypothetical protein
MTFKSIPDGIVEPDLLAEWHRLNKEVFDSELRYEPVSLVWHFDLRKTAGLCWFAGRNGRSKIAIKATTKDDYETWSATLAHEMVHQLINEMWARDAYLQRFKRTALCDDKSGFFMAIAHRIAAKMGMPFKKFLFWDRQGDNPSLKTQSQSQYYKLKDAAETGGAYLDELFNEA